MVQSDSPKPCCPDCQSARIVENGRSDGGNFRYRCQDCGSQFIENVIQQEVSQETKELIERLLLEKISLRGIARVVDISLTWLENYLDEKYGHSFRCVDVSDVPEAEIEPVVVVADESWSFVRSLRSKEGVKRKKF